MGRLKLLNIYFKNIFVEKDADDIVNAIFVNGNTAIALDEKLLCCFVDRGVVSDMKDINSGHHDLANDSFLKGDNGEDKFLFRGIEISAQFCFLKQFADFISNLKGGGVFFI